MLKSKNSIVATTNETRSILRRLKKGFARQIEELSSSFVAACFRDVFFFELYF